MVIQKSKTCSWERRVVDGADDGTKNRGRHEEQIEKNNTVVSIPRRQMTNTHAENVGKKKNLTDRRCKALMPMKKINRSCGDANTNVSDGLRSDKKIQ